MNKNLMFGVAFLLSFASSTWFQQDGAPAHVSKEVKSVIKKTFALFLGQQEVLIYLPLIFSFWGYVKSKVYTKTFSNLNQWRAKIESVINNIDQAIFRKVPNRLRSVVEKQGRQIKWLYFGNNWTHLCNIFHTYLFV